MKKPNKFSKDSAKHKSVYNETITLNVSFADAIKVCAGSKPLEKDMLTIGKAQVKKKSWTRKKK